MAAKRTIPKPVGRQKTDLKKLGRRMRKEIDQIQRLARR
jgi:hypothetical protein